MVALRLRRATGGRGGRRGAEHREVARAPRGVLRDAAPLLVLERLLLARLPCAQARAVLRERCAQTRKKVDVARAERRP